MCMNYVWKLLVRRIFKVAFNLSSQLFCVYCHDYICKHPTKMEGKIYLVLGMFTRFLPSHHYHIGTMICVVGCCAGASSVALICWRRVRSASLLGNITKMWILDGSCLQAYFRHALHSRRAAPVYKSSLEEHKQDFSCRQVLNKAGLAGFLASALV